MEEIKSSNASFSLIDDDLIQLSNINNSFYKQNVNNFILNMFSKTKIQHIAWHIFHSFSVMYPENPSEEEQLRTKNFIKKITTNLSIICSSCSSKNKDTFIAKYDTDLAVSSKTNIIQFFCEYHKNVNTTLRPQKHFSYDPDIYTAEFIIDRYTKNDYISLIETTYNLNLYKHFQLNSMDTFFQLFHSCTKLIYRLESDKYDFQFKFSPI